MQKKNETITDVGSAGAAGAAADNKIDDDALKDVTGGRRGPGSPRRDGPGKEVPTGYGGDELS